MPTFFDRLLSRRFFASFFFSILVLERASSFAHVLFVVHATCVEHGEIIHVQSAHEAKASVARHRTHYPFIDARTKDTHTTKHEHDGCGVFAFAPAATIVDALEPTRSFAASIEAAVPLDDRAFFPELLLVAPKTSPPRV